MKTVTLPLEFVKQAHKAACNDWKKRIEEHVPETAEPELEVGKWYKGNVYNTDTLICVKEIKMGLNFKGSISQNHYGFIEGRWMENGCWNNTDWSKDLIPATKEEVKTALIAEAEKRGLWGDAKIRADADGKCWSLGINKGIFEPIWGGEKLYNENGVIFHKGQWAEIIQDQIPKKLQKLIEELGKDKIIEMLK